MPSSVPVGAREIDVFEDAEAEVVLRHEGLDGAQAVLVDDDDFAGLDVADEFRAGDDVERAAFARKQPRAVDLADAKRTKAERIAHADDFPLAQDHEGKGALHLAQGLDEAAVARAVGGLRHEVQDDFAVDGGLEDGALGFEFIAKDVRVDEVAVVADRHLAARAIDDDGLRVFQRAGAGGGVADVADGARAGQLGQGRVVEDLRHEAHAVVALEFAVGVAVDDDARAFLAAMLQGVEPEKGDFCRVWMTVNSEDTAFILRAVWKRGTGRKQVIHARPSYTPSAKKGKGFEIFLLFLLVDRATCCLGREATGSEALPLATGGHRPPLQKSTSAMALCYDLPLDLSPMKPDVIITLPAQPTPYAVVGSPINHSLSPGMQQAAFDHLGIEARYYRIEANDEALEKAVTHMKLIPFGAGIARSPTR